MAFIDHIKQRLIDQGMPAARLFRSSKADIPPGDEPSLGITDTGGSGSDITQDDSAVEHATAQLTARASTYSSAYDFAKQAHAALGGQKGLFNITLSGVFYLKIRARQNPTDVGLDADSRPMVVFNIESEKEPS